MPELTTAVADKAASIQQRLNETVTATRNNADLSPDGKLRRLAKAYLDANEQMDRLKASWNGDAATTSVTLARDIFGAATRSGVDAISARDADDRASRLSNPKEAADLLELAEQNGDDVLSRAIAQRAYKERGSILGGAWAGVLESYTSSRPGVASKLEELENARRNTLHTGLAAAMIFSVPQPSELAPYRNQLRALADGASV